MDRSARLTQPLVRDGKGGALRPASWDEAFDGRGPRSFGLFSCSKTTNEMNYVAQKLARVAIGSNNVDSCNRT